MNKQIQARTSLVSRSKRAHHCSLAENRHQPKGLPHPKLAPVVFAAFLAGGALVYGMFTISTLRHKEEASTIVARTIPGPSTYEELIKLPVDQLAKIDIAKMNLLCATGLPGAERLDIDLCLKELDEWTDYCRSQIDSNVHLYYDNPPRFHNMEGMYRMEMLVTVLKQDLHIHYDMNHPNDEPFQAFFANSDHLFIHGLLSDNRNGTCSAIPVLITAVGRRLGYPLKIVNAKNHCFVRWEDGHCRFNIEASNGGGMVSHSDDYYRAWPSPLTDAMIIKEGYLKSMEPKEEFACFLSVRASCLRANGRKAEIIDLCRIGQKLTPNASVFSLN